NQDGHYQDYHKNGLRKCQVCGHLMLARPTWYFRDHRSVCPPSQGLEARGAYELWLRTHGLLRGETPSAQFVPKSEEDGLLAWFAKDGLRKKKATHKKQPEIPTPTNIQTAGPAHAQSGGHEQQRPEEEASGSRDAHAAGGRGDAVQAAHHTEDDVRGYEQQPEAERVQGVERGSDIVRAGYGSGDAVAAAHDSGVEHAVGDLDWSPEWDAALALSQTHEERTAENDTAIEDSVFSLHLPPALARPSSFDTSGDLGSATLVPFDENIGGNFASDEAHTNGSASDARANDEEYTARVQGYNVSAGDVMNRLRIGGIVFMDEEVEELASALALRDALYA
ncbi:hypothetical protein EXIGLDRAFT_700820, partial [Exidia glandulosa HHB12029]